MACFPAINPAVRRTAALVLKTLFTLLLVYGIARMLEGDAFLAALADADRGMVMVSVLALWGNIAASALRWRILLGFFRLQVGFFTCLRLQAEAMAVNLVLPGSVGGDAFRVWWVGRARRRYWDAFSSVLADRFSSLLVLLLVSIPLLGFGSARVEGGAPLVLGLAASMLVGFAFLAAFPLRRSLMRRPQWQLLTRLVFVVRRMFRGLRRTVLVLVLSLLVQATTFTAMYAAMAAIAPSLARLDAAVLATALSSIASAVPLTLAGIGLREGAIVLTLMAFGLDAAQAAAVAAVFGLCIFAQCVPGAISWLSRTAATSSRTDWAS